MAPAGGLAVLTSAGLFVPLVMPDIWAGAMILAFALLLRARRDLGLEAKLAIRVNLAVPMCISRFQTSKPGSRLQRSRKNFFATSTGLACDGVAQSWHLSVNGMSLTKFDKRSLAENFSPDVAATVRRSAIWSRHSVAPTLNAITQASPALAAVGLLGRAFSGRLPRQGPVAMPLIVRMADVLLNALIWGVLASPYGRFRARVVWLLPLPLAVSGLSLLYAGLGPLKAGRT